MKKKRKSHEAKQKAMEEFSLRRANQLRQLEYHRHLIGYFSLRCIEYAMYRTELYVQALPDLQRSHTKKESNEFTLACSFIRAYYHAIDKMIEGKMTFPLPPEKEVLQLTRRKR